MAYRVWSVSTTSWSDRVPLNEQSCTWATALNEGRSGQAQFQLGDPAVAQAFDEGLLSPLSRVLIVEWEGTPLYGGIILTSDYDRDTRVLTLTHIDAIWWILARRHVLASRGSDAPAHDLLWSKLTYGTLVNRAITHAQNGGAGYNLPIIIPGDDAGVHSLPLHGYHMPIASEVIVDITAKEMGPDVSFRPRWTASGSVEFVRTSSPFDSTAYDVYDFHVGAPESGVTGLKWKVDASNVTNRLFALGEGSEKNMLVEVVSDTYSPYLALERSKAFKDEPDRNDLRSLAVEELATANSPTVQVSMDVPAAGSPDVSQLRLNSLIRWIVMDDPFFEPGWKTGRVIEFSGDTTSSKVHLEFQPLGG